MQQPKCSGSPRLARIGKYRDGVEFRCTQGKVQRRFFIAQAWRSDVPECPLVEMVDVVDANTVRLDQGGAAP